MRRRGRRRARRPAPPVARLRVLAALGVLGLSALLARAVWLQTLDGDRLRQLAQSQSRTTVELRGPRAEILDRRGHPLAASAGVTSVAAAPRRVPDRHHAAVLLSRALDQPLSVMYDRLDPARSFSWLHRWVSPEQARRTAALQLEGIHLQPERRRFYPHGSLAAAYLGFAGRDGRGLTGLELKFDAALSSEAAALPALRDARGRRLLLADADSAFRPGRDLRLALDRNLADAARRALEAAVERHRARRGSLIALDPNNGEILAAIEAPSFDPNHFWREPRERFRARVFADTFEPGSTLKPFVIALALEAGVVTPGTRVDCESGSWRVYDRTIHDFKPHAVLSVSDIIRLSSNIGIAKVAERLGSRALVEGLASFGFGSRTGSGFPGEAAGKLRSLRESQAVERANLSFGQGLSVTALQLAAAAATLANGGYRVTPRLELAEQRRELGERLISARTSQTVLEMLRGVVESGTGRAAALGHVAVAGKTGTAQKVVGGRYSGDRYVASFLGILPAVNPRLVVVVLLDEPQGVHTGGVVAAPVFREVAQFAVQQLALRVEGAE